MLDILCVYKSPPSNSRSQCLLLAFYDCTVSLNASPLYCSCMFSVLMETMQGWYMQGPQRDTKVRGAVCAVGVGALLLECVLLQTI